MNKNTASQLWPSKLFYSCKSLFFGTIFYQGWVVYPAKGLHSQTPFPGILFFLEKIGKVSFRAFKTTFCLNLKDSRPPTSRSILVPKMKWEVSKSSCFVCKCTAYVQVCDFSEMVLQIRICYRLYYKLVLIIKLQDYDRQLKTFLL